VLFAACASSSGASREVIRYLLRGTISAVINLLALEEAERNLARKRPQALPHFHLLKDMLPFEIVEPTETEVLQMQPFTAYKDAPIIAAAKQAAVDYLLTLDRKHMIMQREFIEQQVGVKILLPSEFLGFLRRRDVS
jgi:predicted nucleic acid-binding protein